MTTHERNPGTPLDLDWVAGVHVNKSAVERRAATIPTRRTVKKDWQAAWLLRAVTCIDLTTLAGDDTPGRVKRLCAKAKQPIRADMLEKMGINGESDEKISVGAVCVYPNRVQDAVQALQGSGIPVASVATGFPAGQTPLPQRIAEIEQAVEAGAREIDVVIARNYALTGDWKSLYDELVQFRKTCGEAHMKTILATGELGTLKQVYQASLVAMMAGSDFIKTSTGKEPVNATLEVSLVMVRAIREYLERTGHKVGFKPAGGIGKAKQAMAWQALMKEELGDEWLMPDLFRFGASSLLTDLERQLYHYITGHYAARHHMPMG
jgi:deoxyribose-phosphate aldolase